MKSYWSSRSSTGDAFFQREQVHLYESQETERAKHRFQ